MALNEKKNFKESKKRQTLRINYDSWRIFGLGADLINAKNNT